MCPDFIGGLSGNGLLTVDVQINDYLIRSAYILFNVSCCDSLSELAVWGRRMSNYCSFNDLSMFVGVLVVLEGPCDVAWCFDRNASMVSACRC